MAQLCPTPSFFIPSKFQRVLWVFFQVKFQRLVEIPIIHWSNPMGFAVKKSPSCAAQDRSISKSILLVKSPSWQHGSVFRGKMERWSDGIGKKKPVTHHFFWVHQWGKMTKFLGKSSEITGQSPWLPGNPMGKTRRRRGQGTVPAWPNYWWCQQCRWFWCRSLEDSLGDRRWDLAQSLNKKMTSINKSHGWISITIDPSYI